MFASVKMAAFLDIIANVEEYIERKPIATSAAAQIHRVMSEFLSMRKFIILRQLQ
jgi:hypothetical protein